jgi:rfaE bifunctional protein kinase chain/domain
VSVSLSTFDRLSSLRVLVIGDVMLDRYLWGQVSRISPEAPVPVVDVINEENRLGGAANVAVNLHRLGVTPLLCGAVGADRYAELFQQAMAEVQFTDMGLIQLPSRRTTVKSRIIGGNQQMLRVDTEDKHLLTADEQLSLRRHVDNLLDLKPDAIIFEDYDKGLLDATTIQHVIRRAAPLQIPIFVDPKFRNFFAYSGVTVFKPNVKELNEALGSHYSRNDFKGLKQAVSDLRKRMPHQHTLVTLSEHGLLWLGADETPIHYPAHYRQIVDVSGAGDTVIGVLAALVASGMTLRQAMPWANCAGGVVVGKFGTATVSYDELLEQEPS